MTGESADNHIHIGNIDLSHFISAQNRMYVFVDHGTVAESLFITTRSKLPGRRALGLPLIRPNRHERPGSGHLKLRMILIAIALKTQAKTANPREQFRNSYHVSSHSAVS